jgi:hypothetical protein
MNCSECKTTMADTGETFGIFDTGSGYEPLGIINECPNCHQRTPELFPDWQSKLNHSYLLVALRGANHGIFDKAALWLASQDMFPMQRELAQRLLNGEDIGTTVKNALPFASMRKDTAIADDAVTINSQQEITQLQTTKASK